MCPTSQKRTHTWSQNVCTPQTFFNAVEPGMPKSQRGSERETKKRKRRSTTPLPLTPRIALNLLFSPEPAFCACEVKKLVKSPPPPISTANSSPQTHVPTQADNNRREAYRERGRNRCGEVQKKRGGMTDIAVGCVRDTILLRFFFMLFFLSFLLVLCPYACSSTTTLFFFFIVFPAPPSPS